MDCNFVATLQRPSDYPRRIDIRIHRRRWEKEIVTCASGFRDIDRQTLSRAKCSRSSGTKKAVPNKTFSQRGAARRPRLALSWMARTA